MQESTAELMPPVAQQENLPPTERAENPTAYRFLGIVQKRLERLISSEQAKQPKEDEKAEPTREQQTAQALLKLLRGEKLEENTEISLTIEKPTAQETQQVQSTEQQQAQSTEQQSELITQTYRFVRIENGEVILQDSSGNQEERYPLSQFAKAMAQKLQLPPHQVTVIEQHFAGQLQQLTSDQLQEIAHNFGLLTKTDFLTLFGIPADPKEREKILNSDETPEPYKKLIRKMVQIIDDLPDVPEAKDVIALFEKIGIKPDQKINDLLKGLPEEQIKQLTEQLSPEGNIGSIITQYYQKIENGEDISSPDISQETIEQLLRIGVEKWQLSEQKKQQIIEKTINSVRSIGRTGGIIALLLFLTFFIKSSQELKGGQQQ